MKYFVLGCCFILSGCGSPPNNETYLDSPGPSTSSCYVTAVPEGAIITCGNSSAIIYHGATGPTGSHEHGNKHGKQGGKS